MINRVADKEKAKSLLKQNENQSGMIGAEVLSRVINTGIKSCFSGIVLIATIVFALLYGGFGGVRLSISDFQHVSYYDAIEMLAAFLRSIVLFLFLSGALRIIGYDPVNLLIEGTCGIFGAPVNVGLHRYYLNVAEHSDNAGNQRLKVTSLFDGFGNYRKFLSVKFLRWCYIVLPTLGTWIIGMVIRALFTALVQDRSVMTVRIILTLLMTLAASLVALYFWLKTWAVMWILSENPHAKTQDIFAQSSAMMKNHFSELVMYELSFLGWRVLSNITVGLVGILFAEPYYNMTSALVYQEMKQQPIRMQPIDLEGNPIPFGGPISESSRNPALEGLAGMYAGSKIQLTPNQPIVLGRDGTMAQVVFSQGAQKISRRHCEVMFNSQTQQYRVTDFSSNGTYVNGSRMPANAPIKLPRGTVIALGDNNNVMRLV